MFLFLLRARELLLWIAAAIMVSLPFILALDFGGFLHWSQWLAAVAVLGFASLALAAELLGWAKPITHRIKKLSWKTHALFGLLLIWICYAYFQTIPLPAGLVSWISPASATAYSDWVQPFGLENPWHPISVAVGDSYHAIAVLCIVAATVWASPIVFSSRERIGFLLAAIALSGTAIAVIGIIRMMFPDFRMWSFREGGEGSPFATFLNRNNAALFMNLGVASSLGILAWRMSDLHDQEVDVDGFQMEDLLSLPW